MTKMRALTAAEKNARKAARKREKDARKKGRR
jgi:signal recognition particle subunit SRP54